MVVDVRQDAGDDGGIHRDGDRPTEGTTSTTDDLAFLRSLGASLNVRWVVVVPQDRRARYTRLGPGAAADSDVATLTSELEAVGRHWLSALLAGTTGPAYLPDPAVALTPVLDTGGRVTGVVVATKQPGRTWTDGERQLLRFTLDYYRDALDQLVRRPSPLASWTAPDVAIGDVPPPLPQRTRSTPFEGELRLRYQPEFDLRSRRIVACEALVRWAHPWRGDVGPEEFIGAAERSGLIDRMAGWIIDNALRDYARTFAGRTDALVLRINVSPVQTLDAALVERFEQRLDELGLPGDRVCVELTESALVHDTDGLAVVIGGLRRLGVRTALDDVGAGYSTLTRLRAIPVDAIKIDRALVTGLADDPRAQAIVGALVRLGRDLAADVVAEGVESESDTDTLLTLGCRRAQGHHLGRPMGIDDLVALTASGPNVKD